MAKWIYVGGILVLAALVGIVFYSWLGGESTITSTATAAASNEQKPVVNDCPTTAGTFFYSQALADKIVKSCSKCTVTNSVRRADYVAVSCST